MESALTGVRVLDLSHGFAGGLAGRLLAEAGAQVTRVDTARSAVPAAFAPVTMAVVRRGRFRRLAIDIRSDPAMLRSLIAETDVVLHEFEDGDVEARAVEEAVSQNPRVIVGRCPRYPDGTEPGSGAAELLVQAWLGLLDEQQSLSGKPMFQRMPVCGVSAAYLLTAGVLAALVRRVETGFGGSVGTSLVQGGLLSTSLYWQRPDIVPDFMNTETLRKMDTPSRLTIFRASDGEYFQVMGTFAQSAPVLERLALMGSSHLAESAVTVDNVEEWREVFATRTRDEWLAKLWEADVACMPSLRRGELLTTQQALANGAAIVADEAPLAGTVQNGSPFDIQWTPSEDGFETGRRLPTTGIGTSGPLAGVRVVDFGIFVSAPFAAQCLADLGASVIKVEPVTGDRGRIITQFLACQRGKRSLALNMKDPQAPDIVHRLVEGSDVIIHNFRERAARSLGLDWSSLRSINPAVVVAHVTGYGQTGPWSHLPGYDPTAQALSGWERGIVPEDALPSYMRNSIMDTHAGCALLVGILAALYRCRTAGGTAAVHTSLLGVAALSDCSSIVTSDGELVQELPILPDQGGVAWNYRIYETRDDAIAVAAVSESERARLLGSFPGASQHDVGVHIGRVSSSEALKRLRQSDVPCEAVKVNHRATFFREELARGSDLIRRTAGREYGIVEQAGSYWTTSAGLGSPGRIASLGEHSRDILRDLGYSEDVIAKLEADEVVRVA